MNAWGVAIVAYASVSGLVATLVCQKQNGSGRPPLVLAWPCALLAWPVVALVFGTVLICTRDVDQVWERA